MAPQGRVDANSKYSTVILFASHKHDDQHGPKSTYGRSLEDGGEDVGRVEDQENKHSPSGTAS